METPTTFNTEVLSHHKKDALLSAIKNTAIGLRRVKDNPPVKLKSKALLSISAPSLISNFNNRAVSDLWDLPESLDQKPDMDLLLNLPNDQIFAGFILGDNRIEIRKPESLETKSAIYLRPEILKDIYLKLGGTPDEANSLFDPVISQ